MKPFDLEKALAGEPVVTRDGDDVSQLTMFNTKEGEQLAGVVNGLLVTWKRDGGYYPTEKSGYDLFMKSKTVVKLVALDKSSGLFILYDPEESLSLDKKYFIGGKAHRIEWEE